MTMIALLTVVGVLLVSPVFLINSSPAPALGVALWLGVLIFRAALMISICIVVLAALPEVGAFAGMTDWFLHRFLPFLSSHFGLEGHELGHFAAIAPLAAVMAVAAMTVFRAWRSHRELLAWLERACLGEGPAGSHIVGGDRIVLATAGVIRPQVFVSMGALLTLDDRELDAGIEHERAHASRSHGLVNAAAVLLATVARPIPGSSSALGKLRYSLERDADDQAARTTGDSDGLASAIEAASESSRCGDINARLDALHPGSCRRRRVDATVSILASALIAGAGMLPPIVIAILD